MIPSSKCVTQFHPWIIKQSSVAYTNKAVILVKLKKKSYGTDRRSDDTSNMHGVYTILRFIDSFHYVYARLNTGLHDQTMSNYFSIQACNKTVYSKIGFT